MTSRLINVRLDERRLQRVRRLRAKGISISDLLRDAIDRQYEEITKQRKPRDIESMLQELYAQYPDPADLPDQGDRKSTRLNSSHVSISYAVFCLKKKKKKTKTTSTQDSQTKQTYA